MGTQEGLSVGGVVGDTYRVTRLLGRGGMGAVWAAEHVRLPGRQVAIKVLLAPGVATGESFSRFRREAEIASRLGHPNIVQVLDFHTLVGGQPYIVLEYLQGETLAQRLLRGSVELEETLAIARQVGSALQAAHRAGVVHRDLKPDNVFLCVPEDELPGPRVKVLDFGISKIRGSQTVATQDAVLMGTPQYMAPEQALGRNTSIDARTDVFALGAIVYEMLGGRPAFGGSSLAEVVYKVVHAQQQPLAQLRPGLPLNVLSAVDRALQKDPAHRPADVSTFVAELTGRPLTVPAASTGVSGLDATLASPSRPVPVASLETDPTFTPATPRPVPRMTEAMSPSPPSHPWATPPAPVKAPPVWAPSGGAPPVLQGTTPAPLAVRAVPRKRGLKPWLISGLVVLAVLGVFRGARRHAALEELRSGKPGAPSVPVPPLPPLSPEARDGLKQGLEEMKRGLQEALGEKTAEQIRAAVEGKVQAAQAQEEAEQARQQADEAREAAHSERRAAAQKERSQSGKGPPPEVAEMLDDAEEALDDDDPKLALRLADQSFFIKKSSAGWSIKARAHCQLKDLGNARAALGNVVGKAARARVVADCKEHGLDLR